MKKYLKNILQRCICKKYNKFEFKSHMYEVGCEVKCVCGGGVLSRTEPVLVETTCHLRQSSIISQLQMKKKK
jgi:hypothetical protein